jgi:opacity protein-like surface antigen
MRTPARVDECRAARTAWRRALVLALDRANVFGSRHMRRVSSLLRPLAWLSVVASLLLAAGPSDAQTKKARRKRPPAGAAAKPNAPAPDAPTRAAPAPVGTTPAPAGPTKPPEKYEEKSSASAEVSTADRGAAGADAFSMLELSVGVRGFQRHLSYVDDIRGVLPSYDLNGAPAGQIGIAYYPLRTPKFSVGLLGSFEYAFALGSTFKSPPPGETQGTKYDTSAMQYAIGLRGNLLLGGPTLFGGLDYLGQSFVVGLPDPTAMNASVPDVKYSALRPNIGGRIALGDKFGIFAGIGYLIVLNAGEITSDTYFHKDRSSVSGFDVNVGVSYALSQHIQIRPVLDYRRYAFKFKPAMTDPYIAGGATDQYIGATVSAVYVF